MASALPHDGPDETLVAEVLRVDLRRSFFMLEGLCRLYRTRFGPSMKKVLERVKAMEDGIGAVDYEAAMLQAARQIEFPKRGVRYLERRVGHATAALAKRVRKRWLADDEGAVRGVSKLVRRLVDLEWDDETTDRTYLCGEIASGLTELQHDEYDMDKLEAGLHEYRRELRWFPIYCTALDGFARLDDQLHPIPEYASLLDDPIAASAYARLAGCAEEPHPVALSRTLYIANTKYIAELGYLKDIGQVIEGLARALRKSGVEPKRRPAVDRALAVTGTSKGDLDALHDRARAVYHEARERRLFEQLAIPFVTAMA